MDFILTSKRAILRNKADFDSHLIVTKGKSPVSYGLWLNIPRLRALNVDERVKLFGEILEWLE